MFTNTKCSIYAGQDKVYTESVCLSTDTKPTTGIANGSVCIEMNTGKKFMFDEASGEWVEVPSSGGGGGGGGDSDFSTAQVTVTLVGLDEEFTRADCPTIDESLEGGIVMPVLYVLPPSALITVPLYKGKCYWDLSTRGATITGDIEELYDGLLITGDGTITLDFGG